MIIVSINRRDDMYDNTLFFARMVMYNQSFLSPMQGVKMYDNVPCPAPG